MFLDCSMGPVLSGQLQSVLQEGLLDSLLPYLVQERPSGKVSIPGRIPYSNSYRFTQPLKPTFLQLPDLSSESDSPGNGLAYRMPSLSMSRQSSGVKSRQNSSSRILLAREHTREEKAARIAVENK